MFWQKGASVRVLRSCVAVSVSFSSESLSVQVVVVFGANSCAGEKEVCRKGYRFDPRIVQERVVGPGNLNFVTQLCENHLFLRLCGVGGKSATRR